MTQPEAHAFAPEEVHLILMILMINHGVLTLFKSLPIMEKRQDLGKASMIVRAGLYVHILLNSYLHCSGGKTLSCTTCSPWLDS